MANKSSRAYIFSNISVSNYISCRVILNVSECYLVSLHCIKIQILNHAKNKERLHEKGWK